MKLLYKLERKFGKYAIPRLYVYLVVFLAFGYVIQFVSPALLEGLSLDPQLIMQGQVWRIISWLLVPPSSVSIFFVIFVILLYYSIGQRLEAAWGSFVLNLYIFSGIILTDIGAMLVYFLSGNTASFSLGSYFLFLSMYLAYGVCYPNLELLIYFIIPVKMKYLAMFAGVLLLFSFVLGDIYSKIIILCAMLNFLVFFLSTRNYKKNSPRELKRKHKFKKNIKTATKTQQKSTYKCAVCGQTSEDNPDLEFRYCSKCKGGLAYCQNHLFTHTHVK